MIYLILAAFLEIAGCWMIQDKNPTWLRLLSVPTLTAFAYVLWLYESSSEGRTFIIYGAIYVSAAMFLLSYQENLAWKDVLGFLMIIAGILLMK